MEKRYVGVDLHRNQFMVCVRLENGRTYLREWKLQALPQFVKKLRASDEVAVEATGNTRWFYDAVRPHVARVVVVATNQFRVITQSVKKTDANDAQLLALYLQKQLLPEVRMKDKQHSQVASLTQTRDALVKLRTALKNKVNNILSARGINLAKEALSSEKKLDEVMTLPCDELVRVEPAGYCGPDPQFESEHSRVGPDHRRARLKAGGPQEPDQHHGHWQDYRGDSAQRHRGRERLS
jgi:transposase